MLTFDLHCINLSSEAPNILDLGCGEGRHIFGCMTVFNNANIIGIDMHEKSLEKCVEGNTFFKGHNNCNNLFSQASIYQLPFKEKSFDMIICSEVMEHLEDYKKAMKIIHSLLKDDGTLLISVPSYFPEKICWLLSNEYQNMPGGHVRIFTKSSLIKDFEISGFSVISSKRFHAFHSPYWWLRCLFWKTQDKNFLVKAYKKFLEYQILNETTVLDFIEKIFNPLLGKSISLVLSKK
jgi:SAM-dependent methyltransferase